MKNLLLENNAERLDTGKGNHHGNSHENWMGPLHGLEYVLGDPLGGRLPPRGV